MGWKTRVRNLGLAGFARAKPSIVEVQEHDTQAFTQGLAFKGGVLFESTGLEGKSSLRRLSSQSAEPELIVPLEGHWGEGIAALDNEITQLTWKSGVGYVYALPDLKVTRSVAYEGEGWGLASYGTGYVMSDGSEWLCFRDPQFNVVKNIKVTVRGRRLKWLNDLEIVSNRIYANRLDDTNVYEIDAHSGKVERIIDCSELKRVAAPCGSEDVLNGIAFNPENGLFAMTGKRWSKLFHVHIPGV